LWSRWRYNGENTRRKGAKTGKVPCFSWCFRAKRTKVSSVSTQRVTQSYEMVTLWFVQNKGVLSPLCCHVFCVIADNERYRILFAHGRNRKVE
jgi:hypothetical protein